MTPPSYAIIADIVHSRALSDRARAQKIFLHALEHAGALRHLSQQPYATVGDEFQAAATTLYDALVFTLHTQLLLPAGLELRFGIGYGQIFPISHDGSDSTDPSTTIQDGEGWWRARAAIDHAHAAQQRLPFTRTRCLLDSSQRTALANGYLALRDQTVARLQERPRRMIAASLDGSTRVQIAQSLGVSPAAVSSVLTGSGAGLLESTDLLAPLDEVEAAAN